MSASVMEGRRSAVGMKRMLDGEAPRAASGAQGALGVCELSTMPHRNEGDGGGPSLVVTPGSSDPRLLSTRGCMRTLN